MHSTNTAPSTSANNGVSLDVYVVGLTENLVGCSATPSTASPIWLRYRGLAWSSDPHCAFVDRVQVTVPLSVATLHPELFGVRR